MSEKYTVGPGDDGPSIAARFGFAAFDPIYEHPKNAALRAARPDPHLLFPGDVLHVPDRQTKQEDAKEKALTKFVVTLPRRSIKLAYHGPDGAPLAGKKYKLVVGKKEIEGTTTAAGLVEQDVSANEPSLLLVFADGVERALHPGRLNPMRGAPDGGRSGVVQRLVALGFRASEDPDELRAGIEAFQFHHELEPDGAIGDALIAKLEAEYGF